MPRQASLERITRYRALARGVKKRWLAEDAILLEGESYTGQQVLDELNALVDMNDATAKAYAAWRAQVGKQRRYERSKRDFVAGVESSVRLAYGKSLPALNDFGLEPPKKPGPKTVAVKAAAVEKGRATREERGTMGKQQRKKVKAG